MISYYVIFVVQAPQHAAPAPAPPRPADLTPDHRQHRQCRPHPCLRPWPPGDDHSDQEVHSMCKLVPTINIMHTHFPHLFTAASSNFQFQHLNSLNLIMSFWKSFLLNIFKTCDALMSTVGHFMFNWLPIDLVFVKIPYQ